MKMTIKFRKGNINPTTKNFPRTLSEAFPENPEPSFEKDTFDKDDKIVIIGCVCVGFCLFLLIIWNTI